MNQHGPAPESPLEVYAARREKLMQRIGDGIAIAVASPELLKSRDTEVVYRPSSDLFYLTGLTEPESAAVLNPGDEKNPFLLFVRSKDPAKEVWSGDRVGVEAAKGRFGADAVFPIDQLEGKVAELLKGADTVYLPIGARPRLDETVLAAIRTSRFGRQRSGRGVTGIIDLESVTAEMRLIKDEHEIDLIRRATRISAEAHRAAMVAARPGAGEWELQAALEGRMRELGAEGPAFPSIVAGGKNATVLHYVHNNAPIDESAMVLIDAGAEYGFYAGDITRTFPLSGTFSAAQREVYDIVLEAEEAAIAAVKPGVPFTDIHDDALNVLVLGLMELGILKEQPVEDAIGEEEYRRFFMHQTSHWLGLDVHDVGSYRDGKDSIQLQPGMILTIEPGLYFNAGFEDVPAKYRGIGVRIEDDVLVTPEGREILTRGVPVAPEEIEELVGSGARVALGQ